MNTPSLPAEFTESWLRSASSGRNAVNVQLLYIDVNDGNVVDGLLFSQIMYWHEYDERGRRRLRVQRDDHFWLAKHYNEWWEECRIDERAARDSIDRMVKRGLLIKAVYGFAGKPTVHIRLNYEVFGIRASGQMPNTANDATRQMQAEHVTPHVNSNTETTPDTETTPESFAPGKPDAVPPVPVSQTEPTNKASDIIPAIKNAEIVTPSKPIPETSPKVPEKGSPPEPKPTQPHIALIDAYWSAMKTILSTIGEKPAYGKSVAGASVLANAGITPAQVTAYVRDSYPGYLEWARSVQGRPRVMPFSNVVENIRDWIANPKLVPTKGSTNGSTIQSTTTPTSDVDSSGNRHARPSGFAPNGSGFYVNGVLQPAKAPV